MDENIAKLRAAAAGVIEKLGPASGIEFGYTRQSLQFIDRFIDGKRSAVTTAADLPKGLVNALGAYVGECLIQLAGGAWRYAPDVKTYGIVLNGPNADMVYPIDKVRQLFLRAPAPTETLVSLLDQLAAPPNVSLQAFEEIEDRVLSIDFDPPELYPPISAIAETREDLTANRWKHYHVQEAALDPTSARLLDEVRNRLERARPTLTGSNLRALIAKRPAWMSNDDEIVQAVTAQELLLTQGQIVWGALVMANNQLFDKGNDDCPALCVHSPDKHFDGRPEELRAIASRLFKLKSTKPEDPEARKIAEMVTNETDRRMNWRLPPILSGRDIRSSTLMVFRNHLPGKVLHGSRFPLLIHPKTDACMIAPIDFWPPEMVDAWNNGKM